MTLPNPNHFAHPVDWSRAKSFNALFPAITGEHWKRAMESQGNSVRDQIALRVNMRWALHRKYATEVRYRHGQGMSLRAIIKVDFAGKQEWTFAEFISRMEPYGDVIKCYYPIFDRKGVRRTEWYFYTGSVV